MELNEKEINQLEKFKEKLEKVEEVKETKKRGRKKKVEEEEKEMKVEKEVKEVEKAVQEVEAEKPVEAVETEKITDKLKSEVEFRLIYWNDMQKEFDHLEYRIYKGLKKEIDEIKAIQEKILLLFGEDANNSEKSNQEKIKKLLGKQ